jgi:hypothetical protein
MISLLSIMKISKLLLPAITWYFLWGCAAGAVFTTAAAFCIHIFAPQSGTDHRPCTPDTALDFNCLYRAIKCTRPALHAGFRMGEHNMTLPSIENRMGTDLRASFAVDTSFLIIVERGFRI